MRIAGIVQALVSRGRGDLARDLLRSVASVDCKTAIPLYEGLKKTRKDMRFSELAKIAEKFFGKPRQRGTSHVVYPVPWPGVVNIQNDKGKAKRYQVQQVTKAAEKLLNLRCYIGTPQPQAEVSALSFQVKRDGADYVGICPQMPELSWYAPTKEDALEGVKRMAALA